MRYLFLVTLFLLLSATAHAQTGIFGVWTEPTGSSIRVERCGPEVCLTLVAISPRAPAQTDQRNPDSRLRQRALCGLRIGSGFHLSEGDSKAEGGALYDPKTGKTYRGAITRAGDTLRLRGYIGIKLFGATETWKRAQGSLPACKRP